MVKPVSLSASVQPQQWEDGPLNSQAARELDALRIDPAIVPQRAARQARYCPRERKRSRSAEVNEVISPSYSVEIVESKARVSARRLKRASPLWVMPWLFIVQPEGAAW